MTPPSPAAGTEEGGTLFKLQWTSWGFARRVVCARMRCNWCSWEGTRFELFRHWLEAHDGRTNFELR